MKEKASPSILETLFTGIFEVWSEMFKAVMDVLPTFISFVLWVLCALIVLPCVFVAGYVFPLWSEWGENF